MRYILMYFIIFLTCKSGISQGLSDGVSEELQNNVDAAEEGYSSGGDFETLINSDYNQLGSKGLKQGVWSEVLGNGNLRTETNYVDGIPHGIYNTYRKDGSLFVSGFMLHGELHGDFIRYDKDGKKLSLIKLDNGRIVLKETFSSNL